MADKCFYFDCYSKSIVILKYTLENVMFLDRSVASIVEAVKRTGAVIRGPTPNFSDVITLVSSRTTGSFYNQVVKYGVNTLY